MDQLHVQENTFTSYLDVAAKPGQFESGNIFRAQPFPEASLVSDRVHTQV